MVQSIFLISQPKIPNGYSKELTQIDGSFMYSENMLHLSYPSAHNRRVILESKQYGHFRQ